MHVQRLDVADIWQSGMHGFIIDPAIKYGDAAPTLSLPREGGGPSFMWQATQTWVQDQYRNASICGNNRVVFNIGGHKYRLVVEMQYRAGIAWVKFIGTHAQYDLIDVETVNEY